MRSRLKTWLPWIVLGALGLGPLLLCAVVGPLEAGSELGQKAAPDWSRAIRVGTGFYGTDSGAPFAVDDQARAHLVWPVRFSAREYDLRYARLDVRGVVEDEHDLGVALFQPRRIQVVPGESGLTQVFLLASFAQGDRGAHSGLYQFTLTSEGEVAGEPSLVSSPDRDCFEYDVAKDPSGVTHIFWTEGAGTRRDMYYLQSDPDGGVAGEPRLVAGEVASPICAMGPGNVLHVFWEQPGTDEEVVELHHTTVDGPVLGSLSGPKLLDLPAGAGFFRVGPVVSFDPHYAYLVWTVEYRRDMGAPAISEGWYGSFALESASSASATSFTLPIEEKPTYVPHDSPYAYGLLAPSSGDAEFGSERITYPSALEGGREAMVTCGMSMLRGAALEHQIVNLVFADGELLGYQVAGNTVHWSRLSNLVADSRGMLHLTWVDGLEPGPSEVYYSSTSPLVRESYDRLTSDDLVYAALNAAFDALAGLTALPLAVVWLVPPLIWAVVLERFFFSGRGASAPQSYLVLVIAVLLYQASKLYFTPALLTYVPFSASAPVLPEIWHTSLRLLAPLAVIGAAATSVVIAHVKAGIRRVLALTLIFCLVDAFLTLMIYGPGLVGLGRG